MLDRQTGSIETAPFISDEALLQYGALLGIQASLTDLLKTFDPKIIEKQFSQGMVLQKKSKCWDSYEEIYSNTVENAVENFFGDSFINAYEQQMKLLTNAKTP